VAVALLQSERTRLWLRSLRPQRKAVAA
jgi:hypothetical protein